MKRFLKIIFFGLIVKPIVLVVLGLNIKWRERLPITGPAIIAANHNSHLDTMVLMSLYPLAKIHKVRPLAAADYFLNNGKSLSWFATYCLDIIPVNRSGDGNKNTLFEICNRLLDSKEILIIFPEGSRGEPEEMSRMKKGVFYIVKDRTDTKVTPVMLHGLGKSLPRGEALLVPYNCDVVIGQPITATQQSVQFTKLMTSSLRELTKYCITKNQ